MSASFEERVASFWRAADDTRPDEARALLDELLDGRDDARARFERASLHDFLGEEAAAIPLYRSALEAGLQAPHRTQAVIQLASSLRNVGDPSAALALLRTIDDDDPLATAAHAFLALALYDDGKPAPALRTALRTLAPHLPAYSRAVAAYADEVVAPDRVRGIVVGVLVHRGHVLAEEYPAGGRHAGFLRAPGGGIEFGETVAEAIRREFAEELGATLDHVGPLGVIENIFDGHGKRGHELVHVFEVRSAQLERLPLHERLPVLDSDTTVGWYPLGELRSGVRPFYPTGILDLLA